MRIFATALSAVLVMTGLATAGEVIGVYDHNGSRMVAYGSEDGHGITIVYEQAKRGLGIADGTWLFKGQIGRHGNFFGTARVFKSPCNPGEYEVTGYYDGDDIVLEGDAPVWNGCSVIGFRWSEHHSYLRFDAIP